jgi:hypothetical protein
MGIRNNVWLAAMTVAILVSSSNAGAQEAKRPGGTVQTTRNGKVTGILTDRLTKSQLKAWKSILEIVQAEDGKGRPVHPALYELYQKVDVGGYEIQIELSTQRATLCAGGFCRIELHAEGVLKEGVLIRLNLGMIDRAISSELTRRADGLIPFAGLKKKKERYAEVLGHELAHVARLLTNPDYRGLYRRQMSLPKRIPLSESPDAEKAMRLSAERKHLSNVLKMVAYQIEGNLVEMLRPAYPRTEDEGRTMIQAALGGAATIEPTDRELRVTPAPLSSPHRTRAISAVCDALNNTETEFPGTNLRLRYAIAQPQTS